MRNWNELHEAAKKMYAKFGHIMLIGDGRDGLCVDHMGIHGVRDGLVFGNDMTLVSRWKQDAVDRALKTRGF